MFGKGVITGFHCNSITIRISRQGAERWLKELTRSPSRACAKCGVHILSLNPHHYYVASRVVPTQISVSLILLFYNLHCVGRFFSLLFK